LGLSSGGGGGGNQNPNAGDPRNRMNRVRPEIDKIQENFSISRAMRHVTGNLGGREDAGLEIEMSQEGQNIARSSGLPFENRESIFLPDIAFRVSTTLTDANAGYLVPTSQRPVSEGYRSRLFIEELGANIETALPGTNNIPVADYLSDAGWVGEADDMESTEMDATLRRATLSAKAIYSKVTNGWYLQAMAGNEPDAVLNRTLLNGETRVLNKTIISRGALTVPSKGLMEADGVLDVTGTNGDAITRDLLVSMINSPSANDAEFSNPAWLLSPSIRESLQKLKVDAGSGQFVWPLGDSMNFLGYKAAVTTLMPTNLTKGTGGATKRGAIFGHWSELVILRWPVRQLIVNPHKDPGVETKLISFWDWAAKNPKAFVRAFFTA
ncbi:MAG TPA: phage major capsid protein, partial [Saprospiraceae bacterium]|nr:phage major capsid protein [Saprospiraceae bacterium]